MIFGFEKKALEYLQQHILALAILAATLLSLLVRYACRDFVSSDAGVYLLPWYVAIKDNGGLFGLGTPVPGCNYNFPYLLITAIMTYVPINWLYAYKLVSCIFDYSLAIAIGMIVLELTNRNKWLAAFAYIATIVNPIVFVNSAEWAQCDSIYTSFLMWAVYFLIKEKYLKSFIFYGFAFAFKLQFIFTLPFFLFYYFYKKRFSILYFAIIPVPLFVLSLPALLQGRSVREMVTVYTENTSLYNYMSLNYPSFWNLLSGEGVEGGYDNLHIVGILLTIAILGVMMVWVCYKKVSLDGKNIIYLIFLLSYTTVLFLPSMHERYGFFYEMAAVVIAILLPKTLPLCVSLVGLSMYTYSRSLYAQSINMNVATIINILIYLVYGVILFKTLKNSAINRIEPPDRIVMEENVEHE